MPTTSTSSDQDKTITSRFSKIHATAVERGIYPRLRDDLLAAIVAGDVVRFRRLVTVLGDNAGLGEEATALVADLEASSLCWQDWQGLHDLFATPAAPISLTALPKGLGGAGNDQELRNVAEFVARHVDDGDLPEVARDILRAKIDGNRIGPWVNASTITSVQWDPKATRVIIKSSNGSETYHYPTARAAF